ncbi:MAG: N-acetylmuramoyl-L-alanine amidase [Paracoccaceae bacterium]
MSGYPSPNFGERRGGVVPSLVVLHYTGMATCAQARARLCDPLAEVSAHWLISETGEAQALVAESQRAWHAGAGEWAGIRDVNSHSIGVELANPGAQPFPEVQMAALEKLLIQVIARWKIALHGVIAHSDMAPLRKADPGRRFDWRRLALTGLSIWPDAQPTDIVKFTPSLRAFGYPDVGEDALLAAFRLRFRPWATGPLDAVDAGMAAELARRFPVDVQHPSA